MNTLLTRVFGTLSLSSLLLCSFLVSLSCQGVRSGETTQAQSSSASRPEASRKPSDKDSKPHPISSLLPSTTLPEQPLPSSSRAQQPSSLAETPKKPGDERIKLGMKLSSEPAQAEAKVVPLPSNPDSRPDQTYESVLLVLCTMITTLVCVVSLQLCFNRRRR